MTAYVELYVTNKFEDAMKAFQDVLKAEKEGKLKDVKRFNSEPVVGFLGDLDNQISSAKVDVDLIFYLARRFSNVKFILIGSKKSWDFPSNVTVLNYNIGN